MGHNNFIIIVSLVKQHANITGFREEIIDEFLEIIESLFLAAKIMAYFPNLQNWPFNLLEPYFLEGNN